MQPQAAQMKPRTEDQHRVAMAVAARRWEAASAANDANMTMENCAAEGAAKKAYMRAAQAAERFMQKAA